MRWAFLRRGRDRLAQHGQGHAHARRRTTDEDDSGGRAIEDEGDSERAILRIGVT